MQLFAVPSSYAAAARSKLVGRYRVVNGRQGQKRSKEQPLAVGLAVRTEQVVDIPDSPERGGCNTNHTLQGRFRDEPAC